MYWFRLAWRNLADRTLSTLLTVLLLALGISISAFLLITERQLNDNFSRNLAGVDLILGAKGSPLQTVLCNLYHIDSPTGNVEVNEVKAFLHPAHPLIRARVPLLLGDSYKTHRLVGTTYEFLDFYQTGIATGRKWQKPFEAVAGSKAAKALALKPGSSFKSSHGLLPDVDEHDHLITITGILQPTGSIADQLILTSPQTVWYSHPHQSETHEDVEHIHSDEANHHHPEHEHLKPDSTIDTSATQLISHPDRSVTSVLVRLKNHNFQALNLARNINENTAIQASNPAIELNRLYDTMGIGEQILRYLVLILLAVGGAAIFIALLQALKDRKYELAIMRVMGGSPTQLAGLVLAESLLMCVLGLVIGLLIAHTGLWFFGTYAADKYKYSFDAWQWTMQETRLCGIVLILGCLAAVFPAVSAYKTEISQTLTDS